MDARRDEPPCVFDRLRTCELNLLVCVGRGFKVSKEDIVGLIVALKKFTEGDDLERRISNQVDLAKSIAEKMRTVRTVEAEVI